MSQHDVLTVVEAKARALPYVVAVHPHGAPDGGVPVNDIPALVIDTIQSEPEPITLGRTIDHTYEIRLTLVLGPVTANSVEVKQMARDNQYDDNMIAAYKDDFRLTDAAGNPTCFNADLSTGTNNFDTYKAEQTAPKKQWRLFVTEHL